MRVNDLSREEKIKLLSAIKSGEETIEVLEEKEIMGMVIQVSEDPPMFERKGKLYTKEELHKSFGGKTVGSSVQPVTGMIIS